MEPYVIYINFITSFGNSEKGCKFIVLIRPKKSRVFWIGVTKVSAESGSEGNMYGSFGHIHLLLK